MDNTHYMNPSSFFNGFPLRHIVVLGTRDPHSSLLLQRCMEILRLSVFCRVYYRDFVYLLPNGILAAH